MVWPPGAHPREGRPPSLLLLLLCVIPNACDPGKFGAARPVAFCCCIPIRPSGAQHADKRRLCLRCKLAMPPPHAPAARGASDDDVRASRVCERHTLVKPEKQKEYGQPDLLKRAMRGLRCRHSLARLHASRGISVARAPGGFFATFRSNPSQTGRQCSQCYDRKNQGAVFVNT